MSTKIDFIIPSRDGWLEGFAPLAEFLSNHLSMPVHLVVENDYSKLTERLIHDGSSLGVFTSTEYARALTVEPNLHYIATAKTIQGDMERSFYFGYFVAHRDKLLTELRHFENQTIGFVTKSSSSGYRFPRAYLGSMGIIPDVFFQAVEFCGSHENVTDGIASKVIDIGVTWDQNLDDAIAKHGSIFHKVAKYGPITNHAIVASPALDSEIVGAVTQALLNIPTSISNTAGFPYSGFAQVPASAYDPAAAVVKLETSETSHPILRSLSTNDFRRLSLNRFLGLIREIRIKEASSAAGDFIIREPTELIRHFSLQEFDAEIRRQLNDATQEFPSLVSLAEKLLPLLNGLADQHSSADQLLLIHQQMLEHEGHWLKRPYPNDIDRFSVRADKTRVYFYISDRSLPTKSSFREALNEDIEDLVFLAQASSLAEDLRDQKRNPTPDERIVQELGNVILAKGRSIPSAYADLGVSGFREIQTYLFNTDPGEGHIAVTCRDRALMHGAAVHIEHIDRDKEADRDIVEPYRLPAPLNVAKVRLNVGSHAPCTAFIGRPIFEGNFHFGLLKAVHMTASACNTMFRNGVADCKIAIEKMTALEAIEFMYSVVGNVLREPNRQFLAAAFNINTPIIDDRGDTKKTLTDRFEIGLLGIELARAGGVDKVTWDGASNEIPSRPILEQLSFEETVTLVHKAHEVGLNCYISAGLKAHHMREATYAGVDGVGIGTSLHFFDPAIGMGALKPEAILEVLSVRDNAMKDVLGKAAALLARLDRLYFEGSLEESIDVQRIELFTAVKKQNESGAKCLLTALIDIYNIPSDKEGSALAQARRLLDVPKGHGTILAAETSSKFFDETIEHLEYLMAVNDIQGIQEAINEVNKHRANLN